MRAFARASRTTIPSLWSKRMRASAAALRFSSSHSADKVAAAPAVGPAEEWPEWLQLLLKDKSPGPRLYRWTLDNLRAAGTDGEGNASSAIASTATGDADDDSARRIYVLGVGNIGRLLATSLAELPEPGRPPLTLVVHRESLLEQWRAQPGVEMVRRGLSTRVVDVDIEMWSEEKPPLGPVREIAAARVGSAKREAGRGGDNEGKGSSRRIANLIVATKAPDALPQVDRLRRYLGPDSTVAFAQNGMSRLWPPYGAFYSAERYGPGPGPGEGKPGRPGSQGGHPHWLVCVVTHGVTSAGPFRSIHASPADVVLGPVLSEDGGPSSSSSYLAEQLLRAPHLAARRVSRPELWILQLEKLVVNAVVNPLTALLRCKNGALFAKPGGDVDRLMDLLVEEASGVLQCLLRHESSREVLEDDEDGGAESATSTATTSPEGRPGGGRLDRSALLERVSYSKLRAMVRRVGEKVKDNTSSMLQDVQAGKKTEIREFNGWLVDTARFLYTGHGSSGLGVTAHKTLIELVEGGAILDEERLGSYFPGINRT